MYQINAVHLNKKELQNTFYQFFDLCFLKKSINNDTNIFHDDITLINQGHTKIHKGIDNIIEELKKFLLEFENEDFILEEININEISSDVSYISSIIKSNYKTLCLTLVMKWINNWKISHIHLSSDITSNKTISNNDLEKLVKIRTSELLVKINHLEMAASLDFLTGLYNRYKFNELLLNEVNFAFNNNTPLSIIFIDIDNFKLINDRYGHLIGDQTILTIANIIKKNINSNHICARWGGDEFVILTPGYSSNDATVLAETIRKEFINIETLNHITITASFGIAQYSKGDTIKLVLSKADLALYKAKRKGKNRVEK